MGAAKQYQLPPGAWDSHVHVVDEERFPFHPDHPYRPKKADLDDLMRFEKSIGCQHAVIVAMSVYSTDNRSILDALERQNGKGRAVVCIDPRTVTDDELDEMDRLGAVACRLNLGTRSEKPTKEQFARDLDLYAQRIRPFGWALQIYVHLPLIPLIADKIPTLGIPVIIDHLGHPSVDMPVRDQAGYSEYLTLLKNRQIWTKLSGTYRFAGLPDLDEYAREIIRIAPTQIVWASDWPHSGSISQNPGGDRTKHQDYRKIDDVGFVRQCMDWCNNDQELIRRIWVDNPRRLWQYEDMNGDCLRRGKGLVNGRGKPGLA